MMRRSELKTLRTVLLFVGATISCLSINAQEEATEPEESITPSILNPEDIFSEERKMLRRLTSGDYPFRRGIFKDDIQIKSKQVRLDSGKKISLVWGRPKKAKIAPAVFIIDVESASLSNQPSRSFFGRSKSRRAQKESEARYLLTSPFGSNLLGQGFAVAYAVAKDLESLRSARASDWIEMFDEIRDLKEVDESSFFLMSTKEYANLSIYLASTYSFSGFILEEPHYMLFTRQTHKDVIEESKWLTSEQIWNRTDPSRREFYHKIFSSIYSPIMIIRAEDSPAYEFNEKTLIDSLRTSNTYFETITLNQVPRRLMPLGDADGVLNTEPRVSYNPNSVSTWLEGMINYLKVNSDTMPTELQKRAIIY
jgi:hypothetical protein